MRSETFWAIVKAIRADDTLSSNFKNLVAVAIRLEKKLPDFVPGDDVTIELSEKNRFADVFICEGDDQAKIKSTMAFRTDFPQEFPFQIYDVKNKLP